MNTNNYYFISREEAEQFQKGCRNCSTRRYFADGLYYVFIIKEINFFGGFKKPILIFRCSRYLSKRIYGCNKFTKISIRSRKYD